MEFIYIATFFVALISSILSGLAGGGGGFIMAPYWLVTGMTPAQGATTGACMALGMSGSSLAAFRGTEHMSKRKKLTIGLLALTFVASMVGPFFLQHIQVDAFKPILAVVTIASLPLIFVKRKDITLGGHNQKIGLLLIGLLLLASSFITSSAFSIFIAIVLSQLLGFSILQGTVVRRCMGIIQSAVIFIILVVLGNFVWQHALAGMLGGMIGSYFGTKFAIKRGETFAKYALAAGALASSLFLLI